MANLTNIYKMNRADYDTMINDGSVTIDGQTYTEDMNALYLIKDDTNAADASFLFDLNNYEYVSTITIAQFEFLCNQDYIKIQVGGDASEPNYMFYTKTQYDDTNWDLYFSSAHNGSIEVLNIYRDDNDAPVNWYRQTPGMTNPMTAQGDIIYGGNVVSGKANPTRLARGSANQFLRMNSSGTAPTWSTVNVMTNPMTTGGDLIYSSDSTGTPTRLPKGSAGQFLKMNSTGTVPFWSTVNILTNPMSTQGDIIYGGSSGTPTRLAKGSAGQVLTMNSNGTAPEWKTGGGGSGTVTSVGAGTGLSISGTATVNPTVNIASGYKLPTTSEWNNVSTGKRETFRNYTVSPSTPYFSLYDGSGNSIEDIEYDISEAYNVSSPNWGVLFEYFRQEVFKLGAYDITGLPIQGPYAAAGLFIAADDWKNSFEPDSPGIWMSTNLLSYFTVGNVIGSDIDSYKVEVIGPIRSEAECTLKITVFTVDADEYTLQICSRWNGSSTVYLTDGWRSSTSAGGTVTSVSAGTGLSISGTSTVNPTVNVDSNYKLQTNNEWQNSSLYSAVSGFNTSTGCATSGFYKSTLWSLDDISGITTPYNGMKIVVRIPVAGVGTAGALLSIDDGANYHPIAYNLNTAFTTHYPVNTNKVFVYNATQTMTGYLTMNAVNSQPSDWSSNYKLYYRRPKNNTNSYAWVPNTSATWDSTNYNYAKGNTATTFTGVWQGESNYDSNTTITYGTLAYYFRPYAAQAIYRYKLVALNHDNRLVPISTTNLSETAYADYASSTTYAKDVVVHRYANSVSKWYKSLAASNKGHAPESSPTWWSEVTPNTPTSLAFRPDKIYWYNTTSTINAGAAIGGNTLVSVGYNYPYMAYCNFNEGILAYRVFYLCGTYNKTTGLFTLRDGGTAGSKLYYTSAPTNTANLTLSNYFTSGYDYILVGGSYSSNNYTHIREDHPMFHFDGTNLVPWDTWNVSQENTTKYNTSDTTQAHNIRILTQSEYNNLGTKDSNTIYLIKAS